MMGRIDFFKAIIARRMLLLAFAQFWGNSPVTAQKINLRTSNWKTCLAIMIMFCANQLISHGHWMVGY
eukprot:scaffold108092_cov59-Attheya_sp.AAC.3